MANSLPEPRGQIAALVDGVIPLDRFMDWYWAHHDTIEFEGGDEDVDLLNDVFPRYAEYTSDSIDAPALLDAFRTAPLVGKRLLALHTAAT